MISTRTIAITGLLAALTLGGCTSTTNRTTPTAPAVRTTAAAPPTPPADYPTARQLADALNNAGIPCTNWEPVDNPLTGATTLGSCYIADEEIMVATYTNHADAAGQPAYLHALTEADTTVVVGALWTLSCDTTTTCQHIAHQFGGELVNIPT